SALEGKAEDVCSAKNIANRRDTPLAIGKRSSALCPLRRQLPAWSRTVLSQSSGATGTNLSGTDGPCAGSLRTRPDTAASAGRARGMGGCLEATPVIPGTAFGGRRIVLVSHSNLLSVAQRSPAATAVGAIQIRSTHAAAIRVRVMTDVHLRLPPVRSPNHSAKQGSNRGGVLASN